MIRLAPVYYTADVTRTLDFLAALGFAVQSRHRSGDWVELGAPEALLCLHSTPGDTGRAGGDTSLNFDSDEDPETVVERLVDAGFADATVLDENFGRIVRVTGPDGTPVQVNIADRSLYA